jgi:hypothetical protein
MRPVARYAPRRPCRVPSSGHTEGMRNDRLHPSADLSAAAWVAARLMGPFAGSVGSVVPAGFEAYARILHPATTQTGAPARWGTVASASGAVEHRLMQFHALVGATSPLEHIKTAAWKGASPNPGDLEPRSLAALLDVLAAHTARPERCFLCLWEGYGWLPQEWLDASASGSRLELPHRRYLLFEGPLDAAAELGDWPLPDWFLPQSPNLCWPDDASWCVATEVDLPYTYVGGTRDLVDELLIDVRLEVWEAQLDDPIAFDSDELNR